MTPNPQPIPSPSADHTQHYHDILRELVDIGVDIARMFHAHAKLQHETVEAGAHPFAPIDFSIPYETLARSIRRSIALAQRLDQPPSAQDARAAAHRHIAREVEDAIARNPSNTPTEHLREDLRTRLDAPDFDEDLDTRPIDDIIAEICHDLGLDYPPAPKHSTPGNVARFRPKILTNTKPRIIKRE